MVRPAPAGRSAASKMRCHWQRPIRESSAVLIQVPLAAKVAGTGGEAVLGWPDGSNQPAVAQRPARLTRPVASLAKSGNSGKQSRTASTSVGVPTGLPSGLVIWTVVWPGTEV